MMLLLLVLLLTVAAPAALCASIPSSVPCPLADKCNCTAAGAASPPLLACAGLARSDWLALAGLQEPVWTALLVADSPALGPGLSLGDLSNAWQGRLESLAIRTSDLRLVNATGIRQLPLLRALDLSGNQFVDLDGPLAQLAAPVAPALASLRLGGNHFVELSSGQALAGFSRLQLLDFSDSRRLLRVGFGFSDSLHQLRQLRRLSFSGCHRLAAWEWAPALREIRSVEVQDTPGWNCTCETAWLAHLSPGQPPSSSSSSSSSSATCAQPPSLQGRPLSDLANRTAELGCRAPGFANFSDKAGYAVGDTARLLCRVAAQPPACITWVLAGRGVNVTFKPALAHEYLSPADTHANTFHAEHQWHWNSQYDADRSEEGVGMRILVLQDASLYIDYVTRGDAGLYSCVADNGIGVAPVYKELVFSLKYEVLREVKKYGIIVGAACAASLLGLGFIIGLIRLVVRKCSQEERNKKQSIKEMLEHLESYRGAKMEQLLASGSGSSGQVDSQNTRVSKVKEACISNMLQMQDSYNRRIAKIRDHCDCQLERLRDSYNCQMGRIKDYKSNQVERVRDQYNQQLVRIKDYAASQLDRLREQYKAQQACLIKMLESVSIDNCVSAGSSGGHAMDERQLKELGLDFASDESSSSSDRSGSDSDDPDDAAAAAPGAVASDPLSPPPSSSRHRRRRRHRRHSRSRSQPTPQSSMALPTFIVHMQDEGEDQQEEEGEQPLTDFVAATAGDPSHEVDIPSTSVSSSSSKAAAAAAAARRVVQVDVELQPLSLRRPAEDGDDVLRV